MGFPANLFQYIQEQETGLVLVTGPTGSGKSTTLASLISAYKKPHSLVRLITVEDPIEFDLRGEGMYITQRQVGRFIHMFPEAERDEAKYTVATTLRAVVSQKLAPTYDKQGRTTGRRAIRDYFAVDSSVRGSILHDTTMNLQGDLKRHMAVDLRDMYKAGEISLELAQRLCPPRQKSYLPHL